MAGGVDRGAVRPERVAPSECTPPEKSYGGAVRSTCLLTVISGGWLWVRLRGASPTGRAARPEWDDNPLALEKLIGPGRRDVPSTDRSDHAAVRSVYWHAAVSVRQHYVDLGVFRCRRARPLYERHNNDLATTGVELMWPIECLAPCSRSASGNDA